MLISHGVETQVRRDDVIEGFRVVLGREPEGERVIEHHMRSANTVWDLVRNLMASDEYRLRASGTMHLAINKCFGTAYLARAMSIPHKVGSFLKTHQILSCKFRAEIVSALYFHEIALWTGAVADQLMSITMLAPRAGLNEGELCLIFRARGVDIYSFHFNVVAGEVIGCPQDDVVLITSMQGVLDRHAQLRDAARAMIGVNAQSALFAALCGVAPTLGASHISGVEARNHVSFRDDLADGFLRAYNRFFLAQNAQPACNGYFVMGLPIEARPLSSVPIAHRRRARLRRALKDRIAHDAARAVATWMRC